MTRAVRALRWCAVACVLALWALVGGRLESHDGARGQGSFAERLLGAIAPLAAGVEWVRADSAMRAGRWSSAYARAESALALAPSDPQGWIFLAHHYLYERTSLGRETDLAQRRAWTEIGLATLKRGEERSQRPGEVWFDEGVVYAGLSFLEDDIRPWKGSKREALEHSIAAFEAARVLGHPLALEWTGYMRDGLARLDH